MRWRPTASLENLKYRARILSQIRAFFAERNVLEVETPLLSATASTDPYLESFKSHYIGPNAAHGLDVFLQTSPEFAMKRLLAAGSGPIYQICKAFRNGELGDRHNPEFTMLEWYRPGFDHHDLMDEIVKLLAVVLEVDAAERISYRQLFLDHVGLDPFAFDIKKAKSCLHQQGITPPVLAVDDVDAWLSLILTHLIEPMLGSERPVFVYDFPPSQAMLARLSDDKLPVAERFELYINGVELANGFHELADADEQRSRFEADLAHRGEAGSPVVPKDEALLAALAEGLPNCAGVAIGIDRLVMLATQSTGIDQVIAFPYIK